MSSSTKPSRQHSLHESRSTDVIEAASRILNRPYHPRSSSPSGTESTTVASQGPTPAQRSKIALIPPARYAKQTIVATEHEMPDEWRDALKKSRITVWDGYALARNDITGEFRLVEKDRFPSEDQSPISTDSTIHEKGFNSYPPASISNSDDSPPPSRPSNGPESEHRMSRIHEALFVINVCLAQFLTLGGLSQTIAPGFIIGTHLGADYAKLSLATAAYGMSLGTLILPAGRLGDMFGHKRIFIIGWLWFAVWSMFCGFSEYRGYTMLVGGRAMQGIGPALIVPNGIALIGRTFPLGLKRNFSISCFGGMGPVGMVTGSAFSSLCAQKGWWQWSFWALACTCALISVLSFLIVPADGRRMAPYNHSAEPKPRWWVKFDLPGALTGVAGLVMINFAFNEAPIVGWHQSYIPFILVLGLICLGIFIYIELRVASFPLIPIKGLTRDAAFTLVIIACGWGSHGLWVVGYFVFQTRFRHLTPLMAVAQKVPVAPIGLACAMAVAFVLRRIRVAWVMFAAMTAFLVGTVLLATAPVGQTYWINTFLSIIIMPLAMNWSYPAGSVIMSNSVPRESQGIAASLISTMVNYSISLGLGMAGSIERYVGDTDGPLVAWRSALYFGVALDALGLLISGYFVWKTRAKK